MQKDVRSFGIFAMLCQQSRLKTPFVKVQVGISIMVSYDVSNQLLVCLMYNGVVMFKESLGFLENIDNWNEPFPKTQFMGDCVFNCTLYQN